MTEKEIEYIRSRTNRKIRQTIIHNCRSCRYSEGYCRNDNLCNYIGITGKMRPCMPDDCRKAGVWEAKTKVKRRKRLEFLFMEGEEK
jgi:hypothetical protein